jgi:zinc transport system substrate-binding protein
MKLKMTSLRLAICLLLLLFLNLACQESRETGKSDNKLRVIATIFPIYDMARNIGGDKVKVSMLLPPATDAHNYELKPDDIIRISKADLFLYVNMEMEHWAYKVIKSTSSNSRLLPVETGSGITMLPLTGEDEEDHHSSKFDPHIWLDFVNAQKMADNIATALVRVDSRHSDYYLKNAADYKSQLAALDTKFTRELTGCKSRAILHAGHWAFAYLANRYGLKYYSIYNVSADSEPEPQKIIAMIQQIKAAKAPYIFSEDLVNPRLAQMIAEETGASLLKLNNGHTISKVELSQGVSFLLLMEENLANLKKGLQCP